MPDEHWDAINALKDAQAASAADISSLTTGMKTLVDVVGQMAKKIDGLYRTDWKLIATGIAVALTIGALVLQPIYKENDRMRIELKEQHTAIHELELR